MTLSEATQSGDRFVGKVPAADGFEIDYFISRRGSSAAIAQEVADILTEGGSSVRVQDYDFASGANFIAEMHEAIKKCRHFIALLSVD
jgi:hypothetical protein